MRNELFSSVRESVAHRMEGLREDGDLPDGGAGFRGLAVVEAQLLERLGERLLERHDCMCGLS